MMKEKKESVVIQEAHTGMLDVLASLWPDDKDRMKAIFALKLKEHYGKRWEDKEKCFNCQSLMRQYTHQVSVLCCNSLRRMAEEVNRKMLEEGKSFTEANKVHVPSLKIATHNEKAAGTIMRYLGLIAKYKENGKQVGGMWVITHWGYHFLNGGAIPSGVTTWRKEIKERSEQLVTMRDVYQNAGDFFEEKHYSYTLQSGEMK